ncbi:MAG: DNA-3-methyladenine glycosylase [Cyanobacteriota bacterium]|nr:DNA-3-methyladenine glycosylase [Cyanobacteriota bacterium]
MTTTSPPLLPSAAATALPPAFFARPAEVVAPALIGCLLLKRQPDGALLWGVLVETEAYSQAEPACHGHRRRTPGNETLFGPPGRFYVYVSYGVHHCVNVVTDRAEWANGVLLRAVALPGEPERAAAGPGLLARWFGLDRRHDALPVGMDGGLWLAPRPARLQDQMDQWQQEGRPVLTATTRIGIREGQELPWRWYLTLSRSVSRRAPGDATPSRARAWRPEDTWRQGDTWPPEEVGRP